MSVLKRVRNFGPSFTFVHSDLYHVCILSILHFQMGDAVFPWNSGCRIHRLPLCRGIRCLSISVLQMPLNQLLVRVKLLGMPNSPSLPLLPCPLYHGVVPKKILFIGQIELIII